MEWTVDVEVDWGGRVGTVNAIQQTLPIIQSILKDKNPIYFVSTEIFSISPYIKLNGRVGSHGHYHTNWKNKNHDDWNRDYYFSFKTMSDTYKEQFNGCYRAPKFSKVIDNTYSNHRNHLSILKAMWFGIRPKKDTIMYLHPFDFYEHDGHAPNLFCKLWYSQPKRAFKLFQELVNADNV